MASRTYNDELSFRNHEQAAEGIPVRGPGEAGCPGGPWR